MEDGNNSEQYIRNETLAEEKHKIATDNYLRKKNENKNDEIKEEKPTAWTRLQNVGGDGLSLFFFKTFQEPLELTNYLKPLTSEKDWEKANFLAFEGLQRLIREKEELTSERNQLLAELDQAVLRLSELETKATEVIVLEARLQQSKQEVVNLSQEIRPLRVRFDEAKAKWAKVQDVILAATERETATTKIVIELEANLDSKIEELAAMEAKCAQLEEKYKKNYRT
ncbi:uncharacterized protein [Nicotiana sylvestris]|uniref:uncharacterized protein n=1 Tax=Nicotiana sylvestris TaxID=4096 RepID=UPI00388CBD92